MFRISQKNPATRKGKRGIGRKLSPRSSPGRKRPLGAAINSESTTIAQTPSGNAERIAELSGQNYVRALRQAQCISSHNLNIEIFGRQSSLVFRNSR